MDTRPFIRERPGAQLPGSLIRDPETAMNAAQRLPASLTALDAALAVLLDGLAPAAVAELPLSQALGCVTAEAVPIRTYPQQDIALVDGWAFRASDLVGVSAYAPLPLTTAPRWVEAGDPIPNGCDCVIDAGGIDQSAPVPQVMADASPGHGVRRRGGDLPDSFVIVPGMQLRPFDIVFCTRSPARKDEGTPAKVALDQCSSNQWRHRNSASHQGKRTMRRRRSVIR